jgi:enoyl-CoA hydratase
MAEINFQKNGQIGILTINRPKSLNALNRSTLNELLTCLAQACNEKLRALILTGEGEKAFIAGADIKEMQQMGHLEMQEFCELGQSVTLALERAPFLTIAAVNGYALGGGLEMALACDFIYASDSSKMGLPEVTLGIIPGFGGTQRLLRAVGTRQAKELILTGKIMTAQKALEIGLVNKICPPATLLKDCLEVAQTVAENPSLAVKQAKKALNSGSEMGLLEGLELEKNMCTVCFASPEREEKMTAFANKNK